MCRITNEKKGLSSGVGRGALHLAYKLVSGFVVCKDETKVRFVVKKVGKLMIVKAGVNLKIAFAIVVLFLLAFFLCHIQHVNKGSFILNA